MINTKTDSMPLEEEGFTFSMSPRIEKAGKTEIQSKTIEHKFCVKHFEKNCTPCFFQIKISRCSKCEEYKNPCKECKAQNTEKLFKTYSRTVDTITTFGLNVVSYVHYERVVFPRCEKCNHSKATVKVSMPDLRMVATVSEKVTKR